MSQAAKTTHFDALVIRTGFAGMYLGWEWSERYPEQPEIMRYMN